jgi:hypothetical protein
MYLQMLRRVTRPADGGGEEISYQVTFLPILISAIAATGTFGNFFLNLGIRLTWW